MYTNMPYIYCIVKRFFHDDSTQGSARILHSTMSSADRNGKGESKLWGGRFASATDVAMEKFNASISYDQRMWAEDIRGSKCYASALHRIHLLTSEELQVAMRRVLRSEENEKNLFLKLGHKLRKWFWDVVYRSGR